MSKIRLHRTGLECLLQGGGLCTQLPRYRGVVQLLGIVEVVPARYASGMDVANVIYVGPYGANDVAFNLND